MPHEERIENPFDLIGKLSESIHPDVDLIDLRKVGDLLRMNVLADGKRLYASRPEAVLSWEGQAITRHGHHREEIKDILNDFKRTGAGYRA